MTNEELIKRLSEMKASWQEDGLGLRGKYEIYKGSEMPHGFSERRIGLDNTKNRDEPEESFGCGLNKWGRKVRLTISGIVSCGCPGTDQIVVSDLPTSWELVYDDGLSLWVLADQGSAILNSLDCNTFFADLTFSFTAQCTTYGGEFGLQIVGAYNSVGSSSSGLMFQSDGVYKNHGETLNNLISCGTGALVAGGSVKVI